MRRWAGGRGCRAFASGRMARNRDAALCWGTGLPRLRLWANGSQQGCGVVLGDEVAAPSPLGEWLATGMRSLSRLWSGHAGHVYLCVVAFFAEGLDALAKGWTAGDAVRRL